MNVLIESFNDRPILITSIPVLHGTYLHALHLSMTTTTIKMRRCGGGGGSGGRDDVGTVVIVLFAKPVPGSAVVAAAAANKCKSENYRAK